MCIGLKKAMKSQKCEFRAIQAVTGLVALMFLSLPRTSYAGDPIATANGTTSGYYQGSGHSESDSFDLQTTSPWTITYGDSNESQYGWTASMDPMAGMLTGYDHSCSIPPFLSNIPPPDVYQQSGAAYSYLGINYQDQITVTSTTEATGTVVPINVSLSMSHVATNIATNGTQPNGVSAGGSEDTSGHVTFTLGSFSEDSTYDADTRAASNGVVDLRTTGLFTPGDGYIAATIMAKVGSVIALSISCNLNTDASATPSADGVSGIGVGFIYNFFSGMSDVTLVSGNYPGEIFTQSNNVNQQTSDTVVPMDPVQQAHDAAAAPEPASLALLLPMFVAVGIGRRRRC